MQQFIGTKILNIDVNQLALAAIDSVAAHLIQIVRHFPEISGISHVDAPPLGRISANTLPRSARMLRRRQQLDRPQLVQNRSRYLPRKLEPRRRRLRRAGRARHLTLQFWDKFWI